MPFTLACNQRKYICSSCTFRLFLKKINLYVYYVIFFLLFISMNGVSNVNVCVYENYCDAQKCGWVWVLILHKKVVWNGCVFSPNFLLQTYIHVLLKLIISSYIGGNKEIITYHKGQG